MATNQFNGATLTWGTKIQAAGMTSFSIDGGSRADVDVTVSTDTKRKSIPGFTSVPMVTVGVLFDYQVDQSDLINCADSHTLTITTTDCAQSSNLLSEGAWLMSYNVTGQIDDVISADLTFMLNFDDSDSDPDPDPGGE